MAIFQNGSFSKPPILKIFSQKFHRLVLGLVGLIDAEGIDVAQPIIIWSEILMFSLVFSKFLAMRNIKLHSVGKTLQNLKNIFSTISIKAFL